MVLHKNSLNVVPSIGFPPAESPTPSPSSPLKPQTQIQQEQEAIKDVEEGGLYASPPCIEIQAAGVRRSSAPLHYSLPPPNVEPPEETYLMVTSEQRSSPSFLFLS